MGVGKVIGWVAVVMLLIALLSVWGAGPAETALFGIIVSMLLLAVVVLAITLLATKAGSTGFGVASLLFGLVAIGIGVLATTDQQLGVGALSFLAGVLLIVANIVAGRGGAEPLAAERIPADQDA